MGVCFDEPVIINGSIAAIGPDESASVMLVQSDEDESFSASLGAADTSDNESETRPEVRFRPVPTAE